MYDRQQTHSDLKGFQALRIAVSIDARNLNFSCVACPLPSVNKEVKLNYQLQINGETAGLDMFTLLLPTHFSTCNEHGLFSYPLFLCWLVCLWSLNCNSVVLLHGSLSSLESGV